VEEHALLHGGEGIEVLDGGAWREEGFESGLREGGEREVGGCVAESVWRGASGDEGGEGGEEGLSEGVDGGVGVEVVAVGEGEVELAREEDGGDVDEVRAEGVRGDGGARGVGGEGEEGGV
jgi:hypothetical protein